MTRKYVFVFLDRVRLWFQHCVLKQTGVVYEYSNIILDLLNAQKDNCLLDCKWLTLAVCYMCYIHICWKKTNLNLKDPSQVERINIFFDGCQSCSHKCYRFHHNDNSDLIQHLRIKIKTPHRRLTAKIHLALVISRLLNRHTNFLYAFRC